MKVLITGVSGYIGSHLASFWSKNSEIQILGIDTKPAKVSGYQHEVGDVTDYNFTLRCISDFKPDLVVHLAAIMLKQSDRNPARTYENNFLSTQHLYQQAAHHGCKQFIFASSCSVYGWDQINSIVDETTLVNPQTPYSVSKLLSEYWLEKNSVQSCPVVCLRFSTAFGVAEFVRTDLMLNEFVYRASRQEPVEIFQPCSWRPHCYVSDIVQSIDHTKNILDTLDQTEIINIGGLWCNYTKADLWNLVEPHFSNVRVKILESESDLRNYQVNFAKAAKLGYPIQTTLEQGVLHLVNYFSEKHHD